MPSGRKRARRTGGRYLGLIATALTSLLVAWFVEPRHLIAMAVFFAAGVAFAYFYDRVAKADTAEAAKTQLEATEERRVFAALVENSSDFIGIADASGKPTYVNPAGRRMVGLSPEQPIEETEILEFYPPDQRAFATEVILKSMLEHGQWEGETYLRNWQTEDAIPVSDKHFMIRDPKSGRTLGMATITRDISDRRKLEDERERAREEHAAARDLLENVLQSSTQYSIIAKDLERRIVLWNRGAARNYGYEASEVIGKSSNMLHVSEELQSGKVAELHRRALEEGQADGLFRRRRKDGSEFLARVVITRRNDAKGDPVGYLIVSRDVTAEQRHLRKQQFLAEVGESLQASLDPDATVEQIARLAVGYIGDSCSVDLVEADGTIKRTKFVVADPAKAELAEVLERFSPRRDRPHPLWTVLEANQSVLIREVTPEYLLSVSQSEAQFRALESLDPHSLIVVPLIARERLFAVVTIASCASGRRYDLEDLDVCEELGRRASLALDNARLYEVAQNALRARDRVLGVVAHDLRNPLSAIISAASLLRQPGDAPERRSSVPVDSIQRAANRMTRLIQDLLDLTRVEAGRLAVEAARVPTRQAVAECLEAQTMLISDASLELRVELAKDTPDVWADRDRLSQVFENLIGNAVKFTQPGGRIVVGAALRDREVLFWVADTGCGIAAADVPRLFDPFWQADKTGRRGSGLGLPIVKGIVEAHGGRIWVESTPGEGSTFYFTIPTAVLSEDRVGAHVAAPQ